jgi:hypothetical protein
LGHSESVQSWRTTDAPYLSEVVEWHIDQYAETSMMLARIPSNPYTAKSVPTTSLRYLTR